VAPEEYLYLDSNRVLAYLSQLENGLPSKVQKTLSNSYAVSFGGKGGPVEAQGTRQAQTSLQETVTPTAASQFYALEQKLKDGGWLAKLNIDSTGFYQGMSAVQEGQFVEIKSCVLVLPTFTRVYPLIKKRLPPLPLTLSVPPPLGSLARPYDLLFPIAYPALANESSLFSTNLTVVGKVIRTVKPAGAVGTLGPTTEPTTYTDAPSDAAFAQSLTSHGAQLKKLDLKVDVLTRQFIAATTVRGPGAVILPIAILK
jgi:hypothetical protein